MPVALIYNSYEWKLHGNKKKTVCHSNSSLETDPKPNFSLVAKVDTTSNLSSFCFNIPGVLGFAEFK